MKEENDLINKPDALSSMMIGKQLLKTFQNLAPSLVTFLKLSPSILHHL